jgi:hypothetical protein
MTGDGSYCRSGADRLNPQSSAVVRPAAMNDRKTPSAVSGFYTFDRESAG